MVEVVGPGAGEAAQPRSRAATAGSRRAVALLIAAAVLWGGLYVHRTSFVSLGERYFTLWDDAMISMRYARNLAEGHGLVWNADGERVLGISNPGVALVMAAVHLLPLPPSRTSLVVQVLGLALLAACMALSAWIAWRLFPDTRAVGVGAAGLTALGGALGIWILQGSDVGFVALWLLLCVALLASSPRWPPALFPVLAVGFWIRIDMALFVAVFVAVSLLYPGPRMRRLLGGAALLAALVGAGVGLCWLYYGDPLPNTYYLKATGAPRAQVLGTGLRDLAGALPGLALPLALGAVATWRHRRQPAVVACAALFLAALGYNTWVGADWVPGITSRFVVPTFPLLWILVAAGAAEALRMVGLAGRAHAAALAAVVLGVGVSASPPPVRAEWFDPGAPTMYHSMSRQLVRFAQLLVAESGPETTICAGWAGIAPYFSGLPAIDPLGKSDRHIARLETASFAAGHSKRDWAYVLGREPDVFFRVHPEVEVRPDFQRAHALVVLPDLFFYARKDWLPGLGGEARVFPLPLARREWRSAAELVARAKVLYEDPGTPWQPVAASFQKRFRRVYRGEAR